MATNKIRKRVSCRWSLAQRLEWYTDRSAGPAGCWIWTGDKTRAGYGLLRWHRRKQLAHRLGWQEANGRTITVGLLCLHRCDNPSCVNPAHLFIGTYKDNSRDCHAKGRRARGEKVATAILTDALVRRIKAALPRQPVATIARRLRIRRDLIYPIKYGRTWRHI